MTTQPPLLEARGLSKRFAGVRALEGVDAVFHRGEIVAVMGENGAGKSTLMKTLAGIHQPDEGRIVWEGAEVTFRDARAAFSKGIAFIHQELNLVPELSVAANIFLGREPRKHGVFLDQAEMRRRAQALLESLGAPFSPDAPVGSLSLGHQQMVEIAKALSIDAKLLIMDEPTSSLSPRETDRLFELLFDLQSRGLTIVYISHRLGEVEALASRVIVLRDGKNSGELARADLNRETLVNLMVGRDLDLPIKELIEPGLELLRVEGLCTRRFPEHAVSFRVREGEIVGLAGLVGAGRTEVLRAIFGLDPTAGGAVFINEKKMPGGDTRAAINAGAALVPEDRKAEGLVLNLPLRENIALAGYDRWQAAGFVNERAVDRLAGLMIEHLSIKASGPAQPAGQLSGGNQQKVVIAKWLALEPKVFLLDEPTRGVDVGAKAEIYETMERLAEQGVAVLFASSELEEILRVADRALVMREGMLAGELTRDDDFTERGIMRLAAGLE